MKKAIFGLVVILALGYGFLNFSKSGKKVANVMTTYVVPTSLIDEEGMTIKTRVKLIDGFVRKQTVPGSFSSYIQNYSLKSADAKVINYDGEPYVYQSGHVGVLEVPVPKNGLQQCADALIRLRAEYLWEENRKEEIGFKFTSGHYCSWSKYAEGFRPKINGNNVSFSKTAKPNASKENLYNYLNLIYTYAGTYSLSEELEQVKDLKQVMIGDLLIYPGFPGHVMMVGDIAENPEGDLRFVFFQGNTPAQSVHIIKNAEDASMSPWYALNGKTSLDTPIYTFSSFEMVRFK